MKNAIFTFYLEWIWLGAGYFNRSDTEVAYFHSDWPSGIFLNYTAEPQPQMPSSVYLTIMSTILAQSMDRFVSADRTADWRDTRDR